MQRCRPNRRRRRGRNLPKSRGPQGEERLVLAFGDSLYAGYGLERGQGLPRQVEERLRRSGINATVVDGGVSGDTTAAGRQRLAFALDSMKRPPDLVILGLGGNDALRQIAPAETRANLVAMLDELKRRNIAVLLTGMRAPPNLGPDYRAAFEPIWPELRERLWRGPLSVRSRRRHNRPQSDAKRRHPSDRAGRREDGRCDRAAGCAGPAQAALR